MGNNERQPITTGIKHWGLGGWVAFAPVSWFLSWDTDAPRNPQRFIPATVRCKVMRFPPVLISDIYFNFLLSLRKHCTMTDSDLKLKLFRQIDTLDKSKLEEVYGVLINYLNGQNDISEWGKLSDNQKSGILDAIGELEAGKGIPNNIVLDKFRKKYSHV